MSGQIISIRLIALAAPLLLWGAGIGVPANSARADDCLSAPASEPPPGSHWYYRTDRAKGRKCWFLRTLGAPTQHAVPHDASATARAARSGAAERPATASVVVSTPTTSTVDGVPPLPPPRPQAASTSSAPTQEPVGQVTQEESTAPPIPEAPASQASTSRQTNTQEPAATPATPSVWPDTPTVAMVKVQNPNLVPINSPLDPNPSAVAARPADAAEGVAQMRTRTTEATKMMTSSAGPLVEILLVIALGLIVASLLYRLVMKLSAARDQRIIMDHSGLGWVHDDRHEHERQKFVDDLDLSLVPAADDYGARRPRQTDYTSKGKGPHGGGGSLFTDKVSDHENKAAQLLRDLDQLLQSRKWA